MFYLALTYINMQLVSSAKSLPYSELTFRYSCKSHLFAMIIFGTFYTLYYSSWIIQLFMSRNDFLSFTAYVIIIPETALK